MIHFECAFCQRPLKANPEQRDRQVLCPACRGAQSVPSRFYAPAASREEPLLVEDGPIEAPPVNVRMGPIREVRSGKQSVVSEPAVAVLEAHDPAAKVRFTTFLLSLLMVIFLAGIPLVILVVSALAQIKKP